MPLTPINQDGFELTEENKLLTIFRKQDSILFFQNYILMY